MDLEHLDPAVGRVRKVQDKGKRADAVGIKPEASASADGRCVLFCVLRKVITRAGGCVYWGEGEARRLCQNLVGSKGAGRGWSG